MATSQYNSYIVAPDPVDVGVQNIVAGSNISITGTATSPIINVIGGSGNNVPIPSSAPGAPVTVATINNGFAGLFYNVASALLPQTASTNNTYRFTFNGFLTTGTITGGTGGQINFWAQRVPSNQVICGTTIYASSTVSPVDAFVSFSGIFIPLAGESLAIYVRNATGGTLTNAQLVPTPRGCGIELVSSNSAPQLIFS
jgi:hypothetical protein